MGGVCGGGVCGGGVCGGGVREGWSSWGAEFVRGGVWEVGGIGHRAGGRGATLSRSFFYDGTDLLRASGDVFIRRRRRRRRPRQ